MDKENKILLSVIIPVYNVKTYLRRCVMSIVQQCGSDIEIILVDDGSTDGSGDICENLKKEFDKYIFVIHKANGGLSSARNIGIENARGKYLFFLDSDDSVVDNFLELIRPRLENEIYDIVEFEFCRELRLNEYKSVCSEKEIVIDSKQMIENILKNKKGNQICVKVYKKELFDNITFPEGQNYEDISTTYRILMKAKKILSIDSQYYIYNFTNENSITKSTSEKDLTDMYNAVNQMCLGVYDFCVESGIDPLFIEYYKRNEYIYILVKLRFHDNTCKLKQSISDYLKDNNCYNLFKFRFYDIKKWLFYEIMHIVRRL